MQLVDGSAWGRLLIWASTFVSNLALPQAVKGGITSPTAQVISLSGMSSGAPRPMWGFMSCVRCARPAAIHVPCRLWGSGFGGTAGWAKEAPAAASDKAKAASAARAADGCFLPMIIVPFFGLLI